MLGGCRSKAGARSILGSWRIARVPTCASGRKATDGQSSSGFSTKGSRNLNEPFAEVDRSGLREALHSVVIDLSSTMSFPSV